MVKLVLLGRLRDHVSPGLGEVELPDDVRTLSALQTWLRGCEPALMQALDTIHARIAVNKSIVGDPSYAIEDGDEIAFLPPMSGG